MMNLVRKSRSCEFITYRRVLRVLILDCKFMEVGVGSLLRGIMVEYADVSGRLSIGERSMHNVSQMHNCIDTY
jgi:hypothetical protein